MMISITMIGQAEQPIYRHTAQVGDLIGITGPTGESAVGLRMLSAGERGGSFIRKHLDVEPQIQKGRILKDYVSAMIDISDGVILDLNRILTASAKGARIYYENVPVGPDLRKICRDRSWNEAETVLAGGEDYQLLFTVPVHKEAALKAAGINYHIIGEITQAPGLQLSDRGKPIQIRTQGYDHFETGKLPKGEKK